ncbi:hypothetical protein TRAPUB_3594 [Trametes pubescens]|uniref:BTB domain-containing protein n=1 Tax=Trametes pubescens TaxID=154538 RepID=A0A1M2VD48_TRAPU|nr:hypothetical protein TRAPUB_3594 [Trametes pubescens]
MAKTTRGRPPKLSTDIILRSADGVSFGLSKVILAKVSGVFRGMLTLPDVNADTGEPQTVELTEDADTLEKLLRLCHPHPVKRPVFDEFDELFAVLDAAEKYDIEIRADITRRILLDLLEKEGPARAYAVACLYKIPMLARRAARLLVKEPLFTDPDADPKTIPPELRSISREAFEAFASYRVCCVDHVATEVLYADRERLLVGGHTYEKSRRERNITHVQGSWVWYHGQACPGTSSASTTVDARSNDISSNPDKYVEPCYWWIRYKQRVVEKMLCGYGGLEGCVVTGKALLDESIHEGESCRTCASSARTHLMVYAQAMAKRIERAIDEVEFDLPFDIPRHSQRDGTWTYTRG